MRWNHRVSTLVLVTAVVKALPASAECCFCEPTYQTSELQITNDVLFGSALNKKTSQTEQLKLNIYQPPAADTREARPIALSIHGGGFKSGDHNKETAVRWGKFFATRGYVSASIDYRLENGITNKTAMVADAVLDAKAAIRYMVSQAAALRLDTQRVAVFGSSAGGIIAYELGVPGYHGEGDSGNPGFPSNITAFASLSGMMPEADLDAIGASVPFVEVHGTADHTVKYADAVATINAANSFGVPNLFYPIEGAGHVPWSSLENNAAMMTGLFNFLSEHLNLPTHGSLCPHTIVAV